MRRNTYGGTTAVVLAAVVFLTATVLLLAGLLLTAGTAQAETTISVNAEVRARAEMDKRDFTPEAPRKSYTDLRSRLGLAAVMEENTKLLIQLQDSRRLGGTDSDGSPLSGTLNNGANVDVHQAFVKIKELWKGGIGIQAGRFEVNLGNQRVFGAVGWDNVGRSWEGGKVWYKGENFNIAAYSLKALERNDPSDNQDIDIMGLTADLPEGVELFAFWEHDAEQADENFPNRLDRYDVGGYFQRSFGQVDVQANGVLQFGTMGVNDNLAGFPTEEIDISAFLGTAEVGYTFPGEGKARVAAGVDFASGDDDLSDDKWKAYNNLYYTGHKFRGYMDYFLSSNLRGLIDLMVRGKVDPTEGWTLKGDVHLFSTAQDYIDFNGEETKSVGIEVDLGWATTRVPGVKLAGGVSVFLPNESFADTEDKESGIWAYTMATTGFGEQIK